MPDVNKIFGLFGDDDNRSTSEQTITETFADTQKGKLGIFIKLIQNNIVFNEKLKTFFKKIEKPFDEEETKKSSEFTVFARSWYYIKDFDVDTKEGINALISYNPETVVDSLNRAIKHFEILEEYEKCAHMYKIVELTKEI